MTSGGGREAQRRRTRGALIQATQRLLQGGGSPTVDDIAREADVARRTVYVHFPTLDQLILDASVGLLSSMDVTAAIESATDPADRVEALARAVLATGPQTLPLGRQIIRLNIERPPEPGPARRGYRRIDWIEQALDPARDRLSPETFERLVSGLSVLIGWESMTVLQDVRDLDAPAEADVTVWACRTLVDAALADPRWRYDERPAPGA